MTVYRKDIQSEKENPAEPCCFLIRRRSEGMSRMLPYVKRTEANIYHESAGKGVYAYEKR